MTIALGFARLFGTEVRGRQNLGDKSSHTAWLQAVSPGLPVRRQSRLVRGNSEGYEMYTIDHKRDGEAQSIQQVLTSIFQNSFY